MKHFYLDILLDAVNNRCDISHELVHWVIGEVGKSLVRNLLQRTHYNYRRVLPESQRWMWRPYRWKMVRRGEIVMRGVL